MDIRDCVHLASQGSLCLNLLAILCLDNNTTKRIDTYSRPATNNGVGHRFVLGCQQIDCYKGRGYAGHVDACNGFGKRAVDSAHFHRLRTDKVPLPTAESKPRTIEVSVKIEKQRFSVY